VLVRITTTQGDRRPPLPWPGAIDPAGVAQDERDKQQSFDRGEGPAGQDRQLGWRDDGGGHQDEHGDRHRPARLADDGRRTNRLGEVVGFRQSFGGDGGLLDGRRTSRLAHDDASAPPFERVRR